LGERLVNVDNTSIWTESFGDPNDEPVLLIMGASVQCIYWPDELIKQLVDAGRFVVRFDNRDTGQSSSFDFAVDPYTLDDMVGDAIGVLDAYGLPAAHIAGLSMGGMIGQLLMINHPARIKTAALLMTSPLSGAGNSGPGESEDNSEVTLLSADDLPGPDPAWVTRAAAWQATVGRTREEKIQKRIESLAMMVGPTDPFDLESKRQLATREFDRALNYDANENHSFAIVTSQPGDRRTLLAHVDIPTLVVHGTADPILPYPHGVALADTIPGAQLYTLDDVGHDLAERYLGKVAERLITLQNTVS
jgi:pimeloyl-ACP methyl ester carboxylesterase